MRDQIAALTLAPTASIREAMQAINRGGLGLALLADPTKGTFKGLVTDGDLRRALLSGQGMDSPLTAVQRPEPKTARVGMTLPQIAALFSDPVRVVPLLDREGRVADLALLDRRVHLPVAAPTLGEKELEYVSECVLTGWVSSQGKFVTQFEHMFASFCGTTHAVSASNGTTALHLALLGLGIGPGDEVIVPTFTFLATANCVTYTGAKPVFVDSETESWNMDPAAVERAVTPRTKAIIPVHVYGHPANMDPIMEIARRHNLFVIEDAAEAHGARYKGRVVGSIGDLGVFSFYGNKIITTGEGGMIVTNRPDLAEKMRILRDHGMSPTRRYWHPVLGYNYRITNIQAALGVAQMERVDTILEAKRSMGQRYNEGLRGIPGLTLPPVASWGDNVYWLYSLLVDERDFGMNRDALMAALKEEGIETRPFFIPCHEQPVYGRIERHPVADRLSKSGLSLPSAIHLRPEEIDRVTSAIRKLAK